MVLKSTHPRDAGDRVAAILSLTEDAVIDCSLDGHITGWSEAAERLFGHDAAGVLNEPFLAFVPSEHHAGERALFEAAKAGERAGPFETRRVAKNGRVIDVAVSAAPVRDASGAVIAVLTVVRDISAKKRAERALAEREELFRLTVQHAPVGISQVDLTTGKFVQANDALCKIVGYDRDALLGKTIVDLVHPDDWQTEDQLLRQLIADEIPSYSIEKRYLHGENRVAWVRAICTKMIDANGRPCRLTIAEDITSQKIAQNTMRDREQRLRAILDGAVDAIVTIDAQGLIDSVNPATERLFGYSKEEMIGRNVSMLMPEPHRGMHDGYLSNYRETGKAAIIGIGRDVTAVRKDGTFFPIHLAVNTVRLPNQLLFTAILHDLTHRRRLEQLVVDASAREQQRIGQDLHDGLGQQLAGLSFYCKSLTSRLEAKGLPEAANARRMADLLAAALTHARGLSHGLNPLVDGQDGLSVAFAELATYVESTFGVPCAFACPRPVPIPNPSYATHVYRIAQEAVTNAVKHAKPWRVTIGLERDASGQAVLSIEDDGSGFAETTGPRPGIGLEIMRFRAGILGGHLTITRGPAGGTLVRCTFPLPPHEENPHHEQPTEANNRNQ